MAASTHLLCFVHLELSGATLRAGDAAVSHWQIAMRGASSKSTSQKSCKCFLYITVFYFKKVMHSIVFLIINKSYIHTYSSYTAAQKFVISRIFNVFLKKFLLLIKAVSI